MTNQTNSTTRFAALALVATGVLATGPVWAASDALIAAAKEEGTVTWYTTMIVDQAVRPLVDAFEAKYPGISVEFSRTGGAETALKIVNEVQAGRVMGDVFDSLSAYNSIKAANAVEPYIADSAAALPDIYRDPDGYWAAPNVYFLSAAINTDLVSAEDAPKSWNDLLDPKWKDGMLWSVLPQESAAPGLIGDILISMGNEAGTAYLEQLATQNITPMDTSQRTVLDRVILGEYPIGLMTYTHHSPISAAKGAPVAWLPIEPVVASPNTLGLVKGSPNPNGGKLLIDYILSEEGQSILAEGMYLPTHPDVPALVPDLLPNGPSPFSFTFMSPQIVADHLAQWVTLEKQIFE